MKLKMRREALEKLNRFANEMPETKLSQKTSQAGVLAQF